MTDTIPAARRNRGADKPLHDAWDALRAKCLSEPTEVSLYPTDETVEGLIGDLDHLAEAVRWIIWRYGQELAYALPHCRQDCFTSAENLIDDAFAEIRGHLSDVAERFVEDELEDAE